jgi:Flp pilus assembly protein TadG
MFSLMTSVLLGFGALSVDIGYMRVTQTELSIAADAASHGGVAYLRRTPGDFASDMATARTKTVQLAFLNSANDQPVILDPNVSNNPSGDVVLFPDSSTQLWSDTGRPCCPL